jgi:hypothetical protein
MNHFPNGPYANPPLSGTYEAVIDHICPGVYGKQQDRYVRVGFRLVEGDQFVVTNFYFPRKKAEKDREPAFALLLDPRADAAGLRQQPGRVRRSASAVENGSPQPAGDQRRQGVP